MNALRRGVLGTPGFSDTALQPAPLSALKLTIRRPGAPNPPVSAPPFPTQRRNPIRGSAQSGIFLPAPPYDPFPVPGQRRGVGPPLKAGGCGERRKFPSQTSQQGKRSPSEGDAVSSVTRCALRGRSQLQPENSAAEEAKCRGPADGPPRWLRPRHTHTLARQSHA